MIAQRGHGVDGLDDLPREVARMRRGKAYSPNTWDLPHGRQQVRKAQPAFRIVVGVDVLAQQLDFGVARVGHLPRLVQHGNRSPAALFAARVRHHAVGAELIAAFNDGDVAAVRIRPRGELRLKRLVGLAVVQPGNAGFSRFQPHQHLRQLAIRSRPGNQRHVGRTLKNALAFLLRHTPQHAKTLALLVQLFVIVQPVKNLLLRFIANGTGIVENQTGVFFRLHLRVPLGPEGADDLFRIVHVHLAAERFEVKRLRRSRACVCGFYSHTGVKYSAEPSPALRGP